MTTRTAWPIAMAAVVLMACDGSGQSGQVSTTFDGNKKLVLFAAFTANAASIGISAWADVPAGTPGTMEMTGPLHMRCQGQFQPADQNYQGVGNLLALDVGEGAIGATLGAPSGHYTAIVAIPSKGAEIRKSFAVGQSFGNPVTGVYDLPLDCVPVADSKQQLDTMLPKYVSAVRIMVARVDVPAMRSQLLDLAVKAEGAMSAGDSATAINDLSQIRDAVQPLKAHGPYYEILFYALDSIALLTQSAPIS